MNPVPDLQQPESPDPGLGLPDLLAAHAHELKNLLGELTLALDEAAHEADERSAGPGEHAPLARARLIGRRVSDRMVQLLTLYKLEQDAPVNVLDVSPAEFIEEIALEARTLAEGRLEIRIETEAAPPFWFFDPDLIQLALMNAVHNALAYARARITLEAREDDGWLVLTVRDDSSGYPAHILAAPATPAASRRGGTGLGLYFSHLAARAHRHGEKTGSLILSNESAGGASFSLRLP
jgi:signal transduction histidine kinase